MAAPVATPRQNPGGKMLGSGHPVYITFASHPAVEFSEVGVSPPGYDAGDGIDISTQHTVEWRQKAPPSLKEVKNASATVRYDPVIYNTGKTLVGRRNTVTYTFPNGATVAIYGYLKSFTPEVLERDKPPMATIEICFTNCDPSDCSEAGPVYTAGTGTQSEC